MIRANYPLAIRDNTLGGDKGNSLNRRFVARDTAFEIAASGGMIGVSPTPLTPYGWFGFGTSIMTVSIIGTSEQTGTR